MKEPLKEVPIVLLRELDSYDAAHLAHDPVAEGLRDLIEDWKRLKDASVGDNNKLEKIQAILDE